MERLHEITEDGLQDRVKEITSEVVDAQFQCPEALRNKLGTALQRRDEWLHEVMKVGK